MKFRYFSPVSCLLITITAVGVFLYYSHAVSGRALNTTPRLEVTTVATGLHNPRGLNFAPNGYLYVAEAGANGTASDDCGTMGDGSIKCAVNTGSIAAIDLDTGDVTRVITGLPSLIAPSGIANGATGAHDVVFQGMGNAYVSIGLGGDPSDREEYFGDAALNYGRIVRFNPSRKVRFEADIAGYELANNPDGFVPDSNPYGLLTQGGRVIVADAGGNDLLEVAANGTISTLSVFPPVPRPAPGPPAVQAVPTSVALGPDGYLYVGQLTGGPFTVGLANVYRVPAGGGIREVAYSGFTNIIDITFGPDGSLYVLEIAQAGIPNFGAGGRIIRVYPNGDQEVVLSGPPLIAPGGIVVDKDGTIYVTNMSTSSTAGSVLRIIQ